MRKILLSMVLSVFAIAFITAQKVETCTTAPISHWSIGLKVGANDMDAVPAPATFKNRVHLIMGGTVDYSINPLAGIGIEWLNMPYDADVNASTTLDANIFHVLPYFSVNLSNLLFSNRQGFWKKVNIFGDTGAGYGFYDYSLNDASPTSFHIMLAKVGINTEYNFCKRWALCVEGEYFYYDSANIGGIANDKGFCNALTATVGLRIKFGADRKQHARNISLSEYNPKPAPVVDTKSKELCQDVLNRLKMAQAQQIELRQKVLELEQNIKVLSTEK